MMKKLLLPGLDEQINFLVKEIDLKSKTILVVGDGNVLPAVELSKLTDKQVTLIVEESENLIQSGFQAIGKNVNIKLMSFTNTDFNNEQFDLIYSQAGISTFNRTKILKELFRILRNDGLLCISEIVSITDKLPRFISDIYDKVNINPIFINSVKDYYKNFGLDTYNIKNLSKSLTAFYKEADKYLEKGKADKDSYNEIKRYKHEARAFVQMGADKYVGLYAYMIRKSK